MTLTNEQIQALEAAAEKAKEYGGIARYSKAIKANEAFKEAATPEAILSLLAEREADKALIAELENKHCGSSLLEREEHHVSVVNKLMGKIAELEAPTLTVKLPPVSFFDFKLGSGFASGAYVNVEALNKGLTAAGITLVVGGEDATN